MKCYYYFGRSVFLELISKSPTCFQNKLGQSRWIECLQSVVQLETALNCKKSPNLMRKSVSSFVMRDCAPVASVHWPNSPSITIFCSVWVLSAISRELHVEKKKLFWAPKDGFATELWKLSIWILNWRFIVFSLRPRDQAQYFGSMSYLRNGVTSSQNLHFEWYSLQMFVNVLRTQIFLTSVIKALYFFPNTWLNWMYWFRT